MKVYYYSIFDLIVASEIQLPQAVELNEEKQVDVTIQYKEMPDWIKGMKKEGRKDFITKEKIWFYLPGFATFYMKHGHSVIIEKEVEVINLLQLQSYILGSVLGIILMQRDLIPVHGGAFRYHEKAAIITGGSGAGKSTVVGCFLNKGYPLIADDISAVEVVDGQVEVLPAYPQQKLCRNTVKEFQYDERDLIYINEDRDKFARRLGEEFLKERCVVGAIFYLAAEDTFDVNIREVTGMERLSLFTNNIYRGAVLNEMGKNADLLREVVKISSQVPMFLVTRPKETDTTAKVIQLIEQKLLQRC